MQICFKLSLVILLLFVSCKKAENHFPVTVEAQKTQKSDSRDTVQETARQATFAKKTKQTANNTVKEAFYQNKDLPAILKAMAKKPQLFLTNTAKDTILNCTQKTKISIAAQSFVLKKTGMPIDGAVQIEIQEYYKTSDILLAGLSTTTNGNLLETAGMLYITATFEGQECLLKTGKTIGIEMPTAAPQAGMELYIGNLTGQKTINWNLDADAINGNTIYSDEKVDLKALPIGGVNQFYRFISNNFQQSDEEKSGTITISFVVERDGSTSDCKIIRGLSPQNDKEALRVARLFPKFNPAMKSGVAVRTVYILPIKITAARELSTQRDSVGSVIQHSSKKPLSREEKLVVKAQDYFFSISRLGWINCDRLWREGDAPKVDFAIVTPESAVVGNLVFHSYKSILNTSTLDGKINFRGIPSNEKVTVVAIKAIKNDLYLAMKETNTTKNIEKDLAFTLVSAD